MKIHSNIITFSEIQAAVPAGCYLAVFNHPGFGQTRCGYEGSRSHDRGFVVRLSGSNKTTMRSLPDKAATWDEWGNFIAALFAVDPDARIGHYKTREDFIRETTEEFNRCNTYRPQDGVQARWLTDAQFQADVDAGEAEGEYVGEHTEDISYKM